MAYYNPKKTTVAESLQGVGKVLVFVVASLLIIWAWQKWRESGWDYHDRMATVQAKGWQAGEYKLCVTVTRQELKYPLLLDCDESLEHDPKFFNVRFWGPVQQHDRDGGIMLNWKCQRRAESDPAITCEEETK